MWRPRILTLKQAAVVVGRDVRTLHRWKAQGMPTGTDRRGRVTVREDVAIRIALERQDGDPAHRWRLRRRLVEAGVE